MMQILLRYNWKKFAVVVSSISGGDFFSVICRQVIRTKNLKYTSTIQLSLQNYYRNTFFFSLELADEYELNTKNLSALDENLKRLTGSEARVFLLYATIEDAKIIFEAAKKFSLTDAKHMWIGTQSIVRDKTQVLTKKFHDVIYYNNATYNAQTFLSCQGLNRAKTACILFTSFCYDFM